MNKEKYEEQIVCECDPAEIQRYLDMKRQLMIKMSDLAGLHMKTRQLEDGILQLNSTVSSYWLELCRKYKINPNLQYQLQEDGNIYEVKNDMDG